MLEINVYKLSLNLYTPGPGQSVGLKKLILPHTPTPSIPFIWAH